jgi:hypothetical protein
MSVSCGAEEVNLDKPPSEFDDFSELFEDDTDVTEVEINNPYDAEIGDKKLLTGHGCKVEGEYFELNENVTAVIETSRLGYSSTNPRVYHGTLIDTRMLLKKMHGARTFNDAIDVVRSSIVPKDESSVPKGATFELSKGSRAVARTARFQGGPILMQESRIFLRGCLNDYEGIYKLDERGEIVDVTQSEYGLSVKPDASRHPFKNFKACSHSDELNEIELKDKEETNQRYYDELIRKHIIERERIRAHIEKLIGLREACVRDEGIHRLPHPQKPVVESKIEEYMKNLENIERKIQTIENIKKYLIVDGKYYYPGQPYVLLSHILNHPSNKPGTLFILKVCKNICGEGSRVHGESRERRRGKRDKELKRTKSHDEYPRARSSGRVVKLQIGDKSSNSSSSSSSGKRRIRSRSNSSGGKIARRVKVNRNKRSYKQIQKKRNKKTRKRKITRK